MLSALNRPACTCAPYHDYPYVQSHIRLQIVRAGALEPLILAAGSDSVEVQREVAATLANLTMVRHA